MTKRNKYKLCPHCDAPILRKGQMRKSINEYQHASGCPAELLNPEPEVMAFREIMRTYADLRVSDDPQRMYHPLLDACYDALPVFEAWKKAQRGGTR